MTTLLQHDLHRALDWQNAVYALVCARLTDGAVKAARQSSTPRTFNMTYGIRVNMGAKSGHSTLARKFLENMDCVLIVPTEGGHGAPYADRARHIAELRKMDLEHLGHQIWVSRPLDIAPVRGGSELTRQDVLEKTFEPLKDKDMCVVDAASRLSEDELEVIRSTPWAAYVELG